MAEAVCAASFMFMPELAQPDSATTSARLARAGCFIIKESSLEKE
jgi:hypothetical protein